MLNRMSARGVLPAAGLGALARECQEGLWRHWLSWGWGGLGCFQGGNWCSCPSICLEGLWESRCCSKAQAELFRPRAYCWRGNMA